jgi:DNA-directed RNA polymerase subunit F
MSEVELPTAPNRVEPKKKGPLGRIVAAVKLTSRASEQQDQEVRLQRRENANRLGTLDEEDARRLYDQLCENVRTTDDISFKLLGFVPLISGVGITVLLSTNTELSSLPVVIFVGLFGAVVTFGLYRWELRNIMTCNWLIHLGSEVEANRLKLTQGQFLNRAHPIFFGRPFGKSEAEKIIYWAAIIAWILTPVVTLIASALD